MGFSWLFGPMFCPMVTHGVFMGPKSNGNPMVFFLEFHGVISVRVRITG